MSNRPKSVYLTERTMSAVRQHDSLSGRMNQIADRYLEMVRHDARRVREMFLPVEWDALLRWRRKHPDEAKPAVDMRGMMVRRFAWRSTADDRLVNLPGIVLRLTAGDLAVLLELLEADTPTR